MKRTLIVVCLVLVLAGCGSDEEPVTAADEPREPAVILDPGEYRSAEVTEDGTARAMVDDAVIALRFTDGQLSATAGCNHLGATYSVEDGVLRLDELSSTDMGCDPERHQQDEWLADFLAAAPTVETSEDGFTLAGGRTSIRFVDLEFVEPDADLVGTTWTEAGFVDGETAMSMEPPRDGRRGTLRFEESGFVSGFDGCNRFGHGQGAAPDGSATDLGLTYEAVDDSIVFEGAVVGTMVRCDGEYAERFHAVLDGTITWEIEGSTLTLVAADGRGVTYTAEG